MFEEDIISVRLIADLFLQMIVTFEPNMSVISYVLEESGFSL